MGQKSSTAFHLTAIAAALLVWAPAAGAGHVGMQAGGFVPWQGDDGYSLLIQLLGSNASGKARPPGVPAPQITAAAGSCPTPSAWAKVHRKLVKPSS